MDETIQEASGEAEPNFHMPNHDAIREDNWQEYKNQGFWCRYSQVDLDTSSGRGSLSSAQFSYGVENVFTGDAFDKGSQRPLRHMPGTGIYIGPKGMEHLEAWEAWWREEHRRYS